MFHRFRPAQLLGLTLVAFCLLVAGCSGNKVTKENADKIKTGMTKAEVEAILGTGKAQAGAAGVGANLEVVQWGDPPKVITVTFLDGKVKQVLSVGF
jgi:hypothetical protein